MIDYAAVFANYTGAFPNIQAINVSAPGAGDGTEFVAALVNDVWGRAQALLDYAGLTPDGVTEAPDTAQILTAINKGFGVGPGMGVTYWKNGTPAANGDRVLLLQGQVITIASYPLLAAAVYVGDANNGTAAAFYKTSDSGGTTRSTAGTYMVLPDSRAVSLKGVGNQTINTRVKSGPAFGAVEEDRMQKITGTIDKIGNTPSVPPLYTGDNTLSGVFTQGASQGTVRVLAITAGTGSGSTLDFSSADSPDARTSSTTDGATRDNTLGTNFGITY